MTDFVAINKSEAITIHAPADAQVTLVCFHFAGGSAQSFYKWKDKLPTKVKLVSLEYPGRARRLKETYAESIPALAKILTASCHNLCQDPCIFIGHSLGALVAYETAQNLAQQNLNSPIALIASARNSPSWLPVSSGLPELDLDSLKDYLRNLEGTPKEVIDNDALMAMALPILRADLAMIYGYQHQHNRALDLPIHVIGAEDDNFVTFEALLAWQTLSRQKIQLKMISGGHFSLIDDPLPLMHDLESIIANISPCDAAAV